MNSESRGVLWGKKSELLFLFWYFHVKQGQVNHKPRTVLQSHFSIIID